ncbi:DnaD and phage-associated domain-containing protein [Peptoniphilus asaccharolyticus DSM 20463]|uniref:DnaD and phage-associated domain-containing protein n=1 Tax=Peptoniphilus asaccharolyticus DSM 20463 TaxID=573058 RepID=A0A1W1V1K9_PEPAS|nr:Lin1244/Lin1753 domain-containing protein [Peptoniphilus asaccharolyticus]MBL7575544.1 DUF4373 domain-containing protein [Peptoniphilus asaccharolyticus]SMB87203.1 DnaD and phage-associated domain-containing protein [Peptoniphilus asaccharolyticus DSM 20463]
MARPPKDGLDYFPLDVDIFEDEKIEAISGEFGIKGEITVVKLLCAIYKNGYFIVWNELVKAQLLKRLPGVSKELIERVVDRLVLWEFFDKALFHSAEVLTSKKIQENYFEATKRRKTSKPTLYIIKNNKCEHNVDINAQAKGVNVDINAQSKVKESKVKEIKQQQEKDVVVVQDTKMQDLAKLYENSGFGQINLTVSEKLRVMLEDFEYSWIEEAFVIAANMNKHNVAYVNGILENWRKNGKDNIKAKPKRTKFHNFEQQTDSMSEQALEDIAKKKRAQALKELGI